MWFLKLFLFGGHHCTVGNSKTKWHQYWRLISYLLVLFLALDILEAAEMCPEFGRIRGFRHEGLEHGRVSSGFPKGLQSFTSLMEDLCQFGQPICNIRGSSQYRASRLWS